MAQDNIIKFTELSEKVNEVLTKQISILGNAATNLEALNASYGKLPSEYVKSMKDALDIEKKQIQVRKELITEEQKKKDLLAKTSRAEKAAIQTKQASIRLSEQQVRVSNRVNKENTKLLSSYNRLNDSLNKAEKNYRDLAVSLGRLDPQTKKARKEVLKLRTQLDQINNPIKRWNSNVGNYASGLKGLAGALGWAGLTFAIVNGVKATFETIKTYDALIKSIEKVTISQQAAASEFNYVSDISLKFGLNLRQTTKDYVSFLASVKGTNLEGAKARDIFEKVSKSAASMGLSAEETSGTLRALNQIISKGKVQAEELRGQLGDRIPGAFQIMARAIGVTTAELDEMLKKGEVIADEVLPKFAAEMEKTFGVENVNRIDTVTSAQNRLSTSWDRLIVSIDSGDGVISKFLKGTFNFFSKELEKANRLLKGFGGELERSFTKGYDKANEIIEKSTKGRKDNISVMEKFLVIRQSHVTETQKEIASIKTRIKLFGLDKEAGEKQIEQLALQINYERGYVNAIKDRIKTLKTDKNAIIDKLIIADKTLKQGELEKKSIKELTALLDTYSSKKTNNLKKESKETQRYTANSELAIRKQISTLTDLRQNVEAGSAQWHIYNNLIKITQTGLDALTGNLKNAKKGIGEVSYEFPDLEENMNSAIATIDKLRESTRQYMKSFETDFFQGAGLGSLEQFFDGSFDKLLEGSSDKWSVYFNGITEVAQEAFNFIAQSNQANFDNEFAMLEKRKEVQLQFAGEGTAARERIEERYEQKRAAIQKRQAEANKKQAIFNTLINTGQAVVSVLAQEPGGVVKKGIAAAIVGGLGLAQVGFIAAQQIPEFKDGVRDFEGGNAIVGDGGVSEIIRTNKGVYATPSTDTLVNLPKGADVFKNHEDYYNSVMGEMGVLPSMPKINVVNNGLTKVDLDSVMAKHFSNIQTNQTTIDKNGLNTYVKKQNSKTVSNNNRVTFKGFSV